MKAPSLLKIDASMVRAAIKAHVGSVALEVKRLSGSKMNQGFRVSTSKGSFILRAAPKGANGGLGREAWCFGALKRACVPVPDVIAHDTRRRMLPTSFLITTYQPGECLSDIFPSKPMFRKELGRSVGKALAKVHSVKVKNFGLLDHKGVGEKKTWDEVSLADFKNDMQWIAKQNLLKPEEIQAIHSLINDRKDCLSWTDSRLIHSDIRLDHVLALGLDVSALLDFEKGKGGDPAWDFGQMYNCFYFNRERPFVESVRTSYELSAGKRVDMKRVWLYCLMERVSTLREDVEIDGTEPALAKRFHRTVIERISNQIKGLE